MPLVGGQGGLPEFGSSVNPITTKGADYAHHITASPPGFENPAASLLWPYGLWIFDASIFKVTEIAQRMGQKLAIRNICKFKY